VCARQPDVSTAAQIKASRALREATLDPRLQSVLRLELRCLLALPCGLERLMVDLWAGRSSRDLGHISNPCSGGPHPPLGDP
jgi:hypothetical protein